MTRRRRSRFFVIQIPVVPRSKTVTGGVQLLARACQRHGVGGFRFIVQFTIRPGHQLPCTVATPQDGGPCFRRGFVSCRPILRQNQTGLPNHKPQGFQMWSPWFALPGGGKSIGGWKFLCKREFCVKRFYSNATERNRGRNAPATRPVFKGPLAGHESHVNVK